MTRLTRAQSQARTRALIVDSATNLFLRNGFQITSLEQIGEEAGFTRGAVYSNFPSKTAMGIAVIDQLYERTARDLQDALDGTLDLDEWFDALAAWAEGTIGQPEWTRLEIELAAFSAHDENYRASIAARYARIREGWAALITSRLGEDFPIDAQALSTIILALGLGTGVQRAVDPDLPGSGWVELLRALDRSTVKSAA
ncbi:MAG TPA: TetR/AcrR family transcriptional regulator [Solirubrobacteraceae bacterium]|nr:TetR/AcrR family transcriptional regulator [Solirubrobacteraceae bacterium]